MFLVLQQEFFADQSAVLLHVTRLKGGARELKLDFLKALLGDHQTHVHWVLGEKLSQISEAQEADRHIGAGLFNFKGSDHLLVIRFLGFTLEAIISREIPTFAPFGAGPWPCLNPVCEYFQERKIPIYQMSRTHKERSKVRGEFSCECGYTYCRIGPDTSPDDAFHKGKVLSYGPVWDSKFRELWFDSTASKSKMASILGISKGVLYFHARRLQLPVKRYAPRPTIESKKPPRRTEKDYSWYRAQWLAIVEDSPGETASALARKASGVLSWLDNHDREWLRANRPARKKNLGKQTHSTSLRNHRRMSIDRDALLAAAVRKAADKLTLEQEPLQRLSQIRICQEIPELRWIPRPHEAPLTAQALKEVAETFENFALRRIDWVLHQYMEERACPSRNGFINRAHLDKMLHHQSVQRALDEAMNVLAQFA